MMKEQTKQTALTASAIIAALALSHFTAEEYTAMAVNRMLARTDFNVKG